MISFVITIADLFTMDSGFGQEINFKQNKHRLVIPVYQREYKWENERIATLLSDISQNSKFIGNTILDESDERYEIVDGQQRITTCFLTLVALYNHYQGHQLEQETIQRKLIPFGRILLENDSIGDYVELQDGKYVLTISADSDIYGQAEDFERAYQLIEDYINALGPNTRISDFKQKLLDSRMLVLINDQHDRSHPVEQLFLDINEKAQLLKVEDIFKGHCFEKFEAPLYPALRNKWANLKRNASLFKKYGFEDTSEYIYTYLLETDSSSLPKNLTISGKHYIEEKTMDETNVLLTDMIGFGEKVNQFYKDLRLTDYRFVNLCRHSYEYRNTNDHLGLKQMSLAVLELKGAIYQKLPLMYFVQFILNSESLPEIIRHDEFRRIITNLYVYTYLFVLSGEKKYKAGIDHSVRDALNSESPISNALTAAKNLRNSYLERFSVQDVYSFEKLSFICSTVDNYDANANWLSLIYSNDNNHNLEHFIIPDNRRKVVKWKTGNEEYDISLPATLVKQYKKHVVNQLVMNEDLNGLLEHYDVVYKIDTIKTWYSDRHLPVPRHIQSTINAIEEMPEYIVLKDAKEQHEDEASVNIKYGAFLSAYFDQTNVDRNKRRIEELFKATFRN